MYKLIALALLLPGVASAHGVHAEAETSFVHSVLHSAEIVPALILVAAASLLVWKKKRA